MLNFLLGLMIGNSLKPNNTKKTEEEKKAFDYFKNRSLSQECVDLLKIVSYVIFCVGMSFVLVLTMLDNDHPAAIFAKSILLKLGIGL